MSRLRCVTVRAYVAATWVDGAGQRCGDMPVQDLPACYLWFGHQFGKSNGPNKSHGQAPSCPHCEVAVRLMGASRTISWLAYLAIDADGMPAHVQDAYKRAADHVQALEDRRKEARIDSIVSELRQPRPNAAQHPRNVVLPRRRGFSR